VTADDEAGGREQALIQSRFRASNDHLRWTAASHGFEAADRAPFTCECCDPNCYEIVMLSITEYEQVRAHPARFLLAAGHEDPEATDALIIEAERGYAIVEKIGTAGKEAAHFHLRTSRTA
jgi:hypothetical protein